MSEFRLGNVPSSSILYVFSLRDSIWVDPPYQRVSDIWPLEKRRLLVDSIINGYDIPKLYFHEFFPAKEVKGRKYKYGIVDGKQRLDSIFGFIQGRYALPDDMEYLHDSSVDIKGLTYAELAKSYPDLKMKFDGFVLPIVTIQTNDIELIEDMFSRLNEAVPLNAAEKRNAKGGPIPPLVRSNSRHRFFTGKVPFENSRYRHYDLVTKFLYIEDKDEIADTKKRYLDGFVEDYRDNKSAPAAAKLASAMKLVLDDMAAVFTDDDWLLRSVGMITLYYYLFRDARNAGWTDKITRTSLVSFETTRQNNRELAEKDDDSAVYHLLEFDRFAQSPNDAIALRYRYAVLRNYVGPKKDRPPIPGEDE